MDVLSGKSFMIVHQDAQLPSIKAQALVEPCQVEVPLVQVMSETGTVALNNYLQGLHCLHVLSWVDRVDGPAHAPQWTCICKSRHLLATSAFASLIGGWPEVRDKPRGEGTGSKKHIARDAAANAALASLKENGFEDDTA